MDYTRVNKKCNINGGLRNQSVKITEPDGAPPGRRLLRRANRHGVDCPAAADPTPLFTVGD